ncbi:MAG: hypothetical protein KatS3mg027_2746 [Bacteroidia bacterium]|nr:MAG: hypothetical protein KatS3mg027_2746 [Bacteroidia bacterium]
MLFDIIGRKIRPVELRLFLKWLFRIKRQRISLLDGRIYEIDPISNLGLHLIKHGYYEAEMTEQIKKLLGKGDTFIDIGANEGYFSILASKLVSESGKVYSIEPQERLWKIILKNAMINQLSNIHLLPFGIGSTNEELKLQLYPSINSGATTFSKSYGFKVAFVEIRNKMYGYQYSKVITLDSIADIFPAEIKLVKIDIEGFEFEALKGAQRLLEKKRINHLLVEIHHSVLQKINQSEELIDTFMQNFGYIKTKVCSNLNLYSNIQK